MKNSKVKKCLTAIGALIILLAGVISTTTNMPSSSAKTSSGGAESNAEPSFYAHNSDSFVVLPPKYHHAFWNVCVFSVPEAGCVLYDESRWSYNSLEQ